MTALHHPGSGLRRPADEPCEPAPDEEPGGGHSWTKRCGLVAPDTGTLVRVAPTSGLLTCGGPAAVTTW